MPVEENNVGTSGTNGPNLMTATNGDDQFGVWIDHDFNLMVTHFKRSTRTVVGTVDLGTVLVTGGVRDSRLSPVYDDPHSSPMICVDGRGIVHVQRFVQDTVANNKLPIMMETRFPLDITEWKNILAGVTYTTTKQTLSNGIVIQAAPVSGQYISNTYTHVAVFSDGALLLMKNIRWVNTLPAPTTDKNGQTEMYYRSPTATTWLYLAPLSLGLLSEDIGMNAAFINNLYVDKNDRVHVFLFWRRTFGTLTGTGYALAQDAPVYLYSDDRGTTWKNVNGTVLTMPISQGNAAGVSCRTVPTWNVDDTSFGRIGNDGVIAVNGTTFTSTSDVTFTSADTGKIIIGDNITGHPTVTYVNATTVTISAAQTPGSGLFFTINPWGTSGGVGTSVDKNGYPVCVGGASFDAKTGITGTHLVRWNGSSWVDDLTLRTLYPTGGTNMNIVLFRGDLWSLMSVPPYGILRRIAAPNETVNIIENTHAAVSAVSNFTSIRFMWPDPVALAKYDSVEILSTQNNNPKIRTFGPHKPIRSTV